MAREQSGSETDTLAPKAEAKTTKKKVTRKRTTKRTTRKKVATKAPAKAETPPKTAAEPVKPATEPAGAPAAAEASATKSPAKRTRRGKRGGAKRRKPAQASAAPATEAASSAAPVSPAEGASEQKEAASRDPAPPAKEIGKQPAAKAPFGVGLDIESGSAPQESPQAEEGKAKAKPPRRKRTRAQRTRQKPAPKEEPTPPEGEIVEDAPRTDEAAEAESVDEDGQKEPTRLVLKPRPPRRARGGRGRRRSGKKAAGAEADAPAAEESPEPAPTEAAKAEGKDEPDPPRKKAKRSRKKKVKKAVSAEPEVADATAPSGEVIDARSPDYKPKGEGREMIINITAGAECRIAVLQEGRLEELYIERQSAVSHVGNIYVGKITNVEPSIQAAFVDFGLTRNGFLHISDVQPQYFPNGKNEREQVGKKVPRRDRPPIQKCFRRGDKVIVQVIKEGVGTKGPTLTSYLSIPGRFVVMMPGMEKLGVSRKIEDDTARRAMREVLSQLTMPEGMGFILRTAGLDRSKRELQSDLNYLNRLWKTVEKRIENQSPPCELYQESDLVIRTIRDVYATDFERIVVDDGAAAQKAREFLRIAMPRTPGNVVEYDRPEPIFHYFGIEEAIRRIHSRYVPLPSGGSIVIDSTEAMVAIDVNSGKFRELKDAEETAFRINVEAAEEIARQLRLRDLGGLVVCDFIDMRMDRHKRAVEKALRDALKKHKERARILRMSKFGLIEMTRQRQRQSIKRSIFVDCPHCSGSGLIKTPESMSLEVMRILQLLTHRRDVYRIEVTVATDVAELILNVHRAHLHEMETKSAKTIAIKPDASFAHDQVTCQCTDDRGMPLRIEV